MRSSHLKIFLKGFSLIELLIVILMISILSTLGVKLYSQYVIKAHRYTAKTVLIRLAVRLEDYYQAHHTYEGASWSKLGVSPELSDKYQLKMIKLEKNHYIIQAVPIEAQTKDTECGIFEMDEAGRKTITGTHSAQYCWQVT